MILLFYYDKTRVLQHLLINKLNIIRNSIVNLIIFELRLNITTSL